MRVRRSTLIAVVVAAAVVAEAAPFGLIVLRQRVTQSNCAQVQRAWWTLIEQYREAHHGLYPSNLGVLSSQFPAQVTAPLKCPGASKSSDPVKGFVYLDWSTEPKGADWTSGQYPLLYDKQLSNHDGQGLNILMVNGSVFWDPNAKWLSTFASQHRSAKISLPR